MQTIQRSVALVGGSYRNKMTGETVVAVCWFKDGDHPAVKRYPIEGRDHKGLLEISPKEKYPLRFGDWIIEDAAGAARYAIGAERFAQDFEEITA